MSMTLINRCMLKFKTHSKHSTYSEGLTNLFYIYTVPSSGDRVKQIKY